MDKMKKIITIIIIVAFTVNSAGQGYALRPMAAARNIFAVTGFYPDSKERLIIDGPHESHEIVLDRLEELKGSVPQGKYILVLNFDMHSDKYGLNPLPESTPGTWASEAENRGLAYVPHFKAFSNEDAPGSGWDHNWNNKKDLSEIMQEIQMRKDEIYEVWVTIDYDFFYVYLANNLFNKTGVESSIREITNFLKETKLWPKRLINSISRICLPGDESTPQEHIDAITNIIEEAFSAPKPSSSGLNLLIDQLSHSELKVREEAAKTIGSFGAEAEIAIPALAEALLDPHRLIIREASLALVKIGPKAYPVLIKALRCPDRLIALAVAENLGYSDPPAYNAIPVLNSACQGANDYDVRVYQSAIDRIKSSKSSSAGKDTIREVLRERFPEINELNASDWDTGSGEFTLAFGDLLRGVFQRVNMLSTETAMVFVDNTILRDVQSKGDNIVCAAPETAGDFVNAGFKEGSLHVITINNITKVWAFIDMAVKFLNPKGLLIITVEQSDINEGYLKTVKDALQKKGFNVAQPEEFPSDYPRSTLIREGAMLICWLNSNSSPLSERHDILVESKEGDSIKIKPFPKSSPARQDSMVSASIAASA